MRHLLALAIIALATVASAAFFSRDIQPGTHYITLGMNDAAKLVRIQGFSSDTNATATVTISPMVDLTNVTFTLTFSTGYAAVDTNMLVTAGEFFVRTGTLTNGTLRAYFEN